MGGTESDLRFTAERSALAIKLQEMKVNKCFHTQARDGSRIRECCGVIHRQERLIV